jgi:hypothetical protein
VKNPNRVGFVVNLQRGVVRHPYELAFPEAIMTDFMMSQTLPLKQFLEALRPGPVYCWFLDHLLGKGAYLFWPPTRDSSVAVIPLQPLSDIVKGQAACDPISLAC